MSPYTSTSKTDEQVTRCTQDLTTFNKNATQQETGSQMPKNNTHGYSSTMRVLVDTDIPQSL